jgi:hypothetical protein
LKSILDWIPLPAFEDAWEAFGDEGVWFVRLSETTIFVSSNSRLKQPFVDQDRDEAAIRAVVPS